MSLLEPNLLIGERVVSVQDRDPIEVWSPADLDEPLGRVPALTGQDVEEAYRVAHAAHSDWSSSGLLRRAHVLAAAAARLREQAEELTELIVRENGKLWSEAAVEVAKAADFFDYYASFARQPYGSMLADARPEARVSAERVSLGVVLLITPWNDPLLTPARKLAPALLAGNSVLLKPATNTPLITVALAEVLRAAGLEDGVLTVVAGKTSEISSALLEAPELKAVSFTGSTGVGYTLRSDLAHRNVRLQTEMGGKNAGVVTETADLPAMVPHVLTAAFGQAGQRCTATSRLIVPSSIADHVVDSVLTAARQLRIGSGLNKETTFGPLISREHATEVRGFIDTAQSEGGAVLTSEGSQSDRDLTEGAFVGPTIIDQVTPEDTVWCEEVFGPVLAVHRIDAQGEEFLRSAIDLTNQSKYGLAASIYTQSLSDAFSFAEGVKTGQVSVNLPTIGWDVHHPFGGFDDSGSAFKEQGAEALAFYSRVKTTAVKFSTPSPSSGAGR